GSHGALRRLVLAGAHGGGGKTHGFGRAHPAWEGMPPSAAAAGQVQFHDVGVLAEVTPGDAGPVRVVDVDARRRIAAGEEPELREVLKLRGSLLRNGLQR